LLGRLIEKGLLTEGQRLDDEISNAFPKESIDEFKSIHEEILKKSNLTEFYEKLKFL
jgi:hypothetical protein